jgi:hypothetical protein
MKELAAVVLVLRTSSWPAWAQIYGAFRCGGCTSPNNGVHGASTALV